MQRSGTLGKQTSSTRSPVRASDILPPASISTTTPATPLPLAFFQRDAQTIARDLLGKTLAIRRGRLVHTARIVETEAYVGPHDLACHASKGRTARNEIMFGPGGHAYIYFIYGMYHMLNFVTGHPGDPQAVLIRAAEPLAGWQADLSGPGKLARAFDLTRKDNGLPLTGPRITVLDPGTPPPAIAASPRIGVDYAGPWRHAHLRFFDPTSPAVSGRRTRRQQHIPTCYQRRCD